MRDEARRTGIAVIAFLILTAGSVLAAGITATSHIAAGPLPAHFALAEPRVGDSGTFIWGRVQVEPDGTVRVLNEHEILGFEWLPPSSAADASGVRHDALMLHQWGWQPQASGSDPATVPQDGWERYAEPVYAIDLATDRILSYSYISQATANPDQNTQSRSLQRMFISPGERFEPACGAFPAYGGREIPLDKPVDLFRACTGLANILTTDAHAAVKAVGTQQLGDRQTVLFSSEGGSYHVWYNATIPVPLRIAARTCDAPRFFPSFPSCKDGEYDVLRLESFRRGETPLPSHSDTAPTNTVAPNWDLRSLARGLPDESGIDHPFPASEAIVAARNNPNGTTFRDVLDRGYVTFLDYREHLGSESAIRTWDISAYDGQHTASVAVERRIETRATSPAPGSIPILPPTQPAGGPTSVTTTSVNIATERSSGPWPNPRDAPITAPTVTSMWARWRGFASTEYANTQPNVWGMRIGCLGAERGECSVFVERWAGVDQTTEASGGTMSLTSVLWESDHEQRGHEMTLREDWYDSRAPSESPVRIQSIAAPGAFTTIKSNAWVVPATQVVVRSTLFAGFVSLAYLLWPTLRLGVMGLFTRHSTPPEVLRNAQRQRMMDAIRKHPGLTAPELARALSRGRSPTEHHLAMLQRVGLVRVSREGAKRHFYASDADPTAHRQPAALSSDLARRILESRRANPNISVREAARAFDVSPGTVSYHLARLRESNLLAETE